MTIVVLKLIAVVLMDIKLLILDLPPRTAHPDDLGHVGLLDLQVREPGIMVDRLALAVVFPHLHERPPHPMRGCQGHRAHHPVGEISPPTRRTFMPRAMLTSP